MGMSTSIVGFVSPDDEIYQKQVKVLEACINAGISELPKETAAYFGGKYAEPYLIEDKLTTDIIIHEYNSDYENGYEIIVSEIPEGVHKIRFTNSW